MHGQRSSDMAFDETLILGTASNSRIRYDESGQYPTRLITPEDSRSSARSVNSSSPSGSVRRGAPVHELLLPRTPETTAGFVEQGRQMPHSRRDSFHDPLPKPNEQRRHEENAPSLPPLKQLFGGSMSSPPGTPHPLSAGQPSPCEPTYTASTYKPPALYPNKKPRTDIPLDGDRPFRSACRPVHLPRVDIADERWSQDVRSHPSPPRGYMPDRVGRQGQPEQHRSGMSIESRFPPQDGTNGMTRTGYGPPPYHTPEHTPTSSHVDMGKNVRIVACHCYQTNPTNRALQPPVRNATFSKIVGQ